tara:strand:+ start:559 stop:849 length:291 start_codon:yes stop_codon:yes gene_type:complete
MAKLKLKDVRKVIADEGLIYLKSGGFDSYGHPTVVVEFPEMDGDNNIGRVSYSGTPRNPRKALFRFRTKLRKIVSGRDLLDPYLEKSSEEINSFFE